MKGFCSKNRTSVCIFYVVVPSTDFAVYTVCICLLTYQMIVKRIFQIVIFICIFSDIKTSLFQNLPFQEKQSVLTTQQNHFNPATANTFDE
jgi:hypothetical protein